MKGSAAGALSTSLYLSIPLYTSLYLSRSGMNAAYICFGCRIRNIIYTGIFKTNMQFQTFDLLRHTHHIVQSIGLSLLMRIATVWHVEAAAAAAAAATALPTEEGPLYLGVALCSLALCV